MDPEISEAPQLTLRRVQRRTLLAEQMQQRAGDFHDFVSAWGDFDVIVNGDEVPDSVSGKMTSEQTYEAAGSKNVIGKTEANHFKRAATYLPIIACRADGTVVDIPPVIIHRCASRKLNTVEVRALVLGSETGVMTSEMMCKRVVPHIAANLGGFERKLVIFDSARSHITEAVLDAFKARGMVPCVIPGGMTQFLQFVDVFWAARYRHYRLISYTEDESKPTTAMVTSSGAQRSTHRWSKTSSQRMVRHLSSTASLGSATFALISPKGGRLHVHRPSKSRTATAGPSGAAKTCAAVPARAAGDITPAEALERDRLRQDVVEVGPRQLTVFDRLPAESHHHHHHQLLSNLWVEPRHSHQ